MRNRQLISHAAAGSTATAEKGNIFCYRDAVGAKMLTIDGEDEKISPIAYSASAIFTCNAKVTPSSISAELTW